LFDIIQSVRRFTEQRIHELCSEVGTAKGADLERVLKELRSALEEHISLAKDTLTAQASNISRFDSKNIA
jgi:hypothetical protein